MKKLDNIALTKFVIMVAEGKSDAYISRILGLSRPVCADRRKALVNLVGKQWARFTELAETHGKLREATISENAAMLAKIDSEMDKRVLSAMTTDNLLNLRLKLIMSMPQSEQELK